MKNFAIINEVEIDFKDHLNIITGETGAGKSIIIGSVNAALGAKISKDIVRNGAEYALVELVFETKDEAVFHAMRELDIPVEGDQIIISRKIMAGRSICRINGENVTASALAAIAGMLIDIHGQHEHQSLLNKAKHLEIVDRFARDEIGDLKAELEESYKEYQRLRQEYEHSGMDEEKRLREIAFLEYEVNEIKSAALVPGEDEELAGRYKKLSNANILSEGLQNTYRYTGYDAVAAGDSVGRALRQLMKLTEYDEEIGGFLNQVSEIDGLLNDLNRDLSQYIADMENPEEELEEVTRRLDRINHLKSKYGNSMEQILNYCKDCEEKLSRYRDYDEYMDKLGKELASAQNRLEQLCSSLSAIRKSKAKELTERIREALVALNFLEVRFDMVFEQASHYSPNGYDDGEFILSTNPGEALKPLSKVASGGELSRIMLGIKSVLAEKDEIETLIFDEIDVGISGRTAQKVSEQLSLIARHHQIICITHLAQIAAMADAHYVIEKETDGVSTQTVIRTLKESETIDELSRLLGGAQITERVRESAREMKELASAAKKYIL
ncbi:DNA repair protein RecN (Recombination protein N) [Anaerotaenia torta]|uniref:DNA repair protein RecN n=1 Tax=Anaerotaenia torta TaxID=433293 RepID=UPI003D2016FF